MSDIILKRDNYKVSPLEQEPVSNIGKHKNRKGMNWIVTGLFIVGEMAGGGLVAMPTAMVDAGIWAGILITILGAVFSGYTGVQLGDNWTLMQSRWSVYRERCRKPYLEMAYRAFGPKAKVFVLTCLCLTQFGIAVVFVLLASKNISSFLSTFFSLNINYCWLIVIVAITLIPAIMLKGPKDFWQAAVGAMISTSLAVILIIVGVIHDSGTCKPVAVYPGIHFEKFFLAFGTIMFAYGGHGCFPTIQHDMKKPYQFHRSVWLSYIIIVAMYLPVSVAGYLVYGDALGDSIISSIQLKGIQQAVNFLITIHVLLTVIIIFSPLSQGVEDLLGVHPHFGWQRVLTRSILMLAVLFMALTAPSFGYFLDLVGSSTITMMTMILPGIFNVYLVAGWEKRQEKIRNGDIDEKSVDEERANLSDVFTYIPKPILILNVVVWIFGIAGGIVSTYAAIKHMIDGSMEAPCYVQAFRQGGFGFHSQSSGNVACCGPDRNVTWHSDVSVCF